MSALEEDDDLEAGDRPQFGGAFTPPVRSVAHSTASGLNAKGGVGSPRIASNKGSTASGLPGQSLASSLDQSSTSSRPSMQQGSSFARSFKRHRNRGKVGVATSNESIDLKDPKNQPAPTKGRGCMGNRPIPMWALMILVNVFCVAIVAIGVATSAALLGKQAVQDVADQLRYSLLRQAEYAVQKAVWDTEGASYTLAANPTFVGLIQGSSGRTDLKAVYDASVAPLLKAICSESPQLASVAFATRFPSYIGFFPAANFADSTSLILDSTSPDGHYYYVNGTLAKTSTNFNPVVRPYYAAMINANYKAGWTVAYQSNNVGGDFLKPFFVPILTANATGNAAADTIGEIYLTISALSLRATLLDIPRTDNTCFVIVDTGNNGILASTLAYDQYINSTTIAGAVVRAPYTLDASPNKLLNAAGVALTQALASADTEYASTFQFSGTWDFSVAYATSHVDSMRLLILVMTPQSDYMGGVTRSNKISIILVVVFSVLGAILAAMAGLLVSRPLIRLTRLMRKVQRMELARSADSLDTVMSSVREVRNLENGFEQMVLGLRSFEKFVPSAVVKTLLKNSVEADLEVHRREISIFFSDIADFTMIAESMKPKNLILLLAEYLTEMSNIIVASEGTVGEFIGDAIMAYWNSPEEVGEHASRACASALKQLATLETELNKKWKANGWPHISIRCGINTGFVLHGIIGSRTRMKWGLVGDSVNLASRLESLCKRYRVSVCISDATLHHLRPEDYWIFPMDVVAVKGKGKGTKLFELAARRGEPTDAALSKKHEAWTMVWTAYVEKKWGLAREALTVFLVTYGSYGPALNIRDRLDEFAKLPPPDTWDGVHALHEK
ncbi:hypothetical protein HDU87_001513 [Geranomyces variabilis]|uniref:Guanylate cyclase domain-containing protein n=1 Tax=Geranomyces variabilis TaxID=109894 RepID=A0AAD5XL89_9FUNG|nr:hypothetical protein HDU87_001513 [Geranomyces variabilis]